MSISAEWVLRRIEFVLTVPELAIDTFFPQELAMGTLLGYATFF